MNQLIISSDQIDALRAHAQREAPLEACGILSGRNGRVEAFHPMTNVDRSPEHFTMDPKEQFAVAKAIRASGQAMLAVFHSHPASPARPSEEDVRLAATPDVVYVILSLLDRGSPALKGFWIDESGVTEIPVTVQETRGADSARKLEEPLLRLPGSIATDVAEYRRRLDAHLRGKSNPAVFRATRVPMGIYEQRQSGRYMVRVRLGAGLVLSFQLRRLAELSATFGNGVAHVTTRQDIQIHDVSLANTARLQQLLLEVGLSSRGGGGNTVRNITACPRASVCPKAIFDVAPHSIALTELLLEEPSSFNLPRKFKIAFSGCSEDCAFASVNDLGFFARERQGQRGFAVYAAGGLGSQPRSGIRIEEFVEEERFFEVARAVKELFGLRGDRLDKHHARLRFVLARLGEEGFIRAYREQLETVRARTGDASRPALRTLDSYFDDGTGPAAARDADAVLLPGVLRDRQSGRFSIEVRLAHGQIPADSLTRLAELAEGLGCGVVVATQEQNLLIPAVRGSRLLEARRALDAISGVIPSGPPHITACAGASTCRLGLCMSPALADTIAARLAAMAANGGRGPRSIRISGCPSCCGDHLLAELGFEGTARRHQGRLQPCYHVLAGGSVSEGDARLGVRLGLLPARAVPEFVAAVYGQGARSIDELRKLVQAQSAADFDTPDEYFTDVGSTEPFSLKGRGPGECGAGVLDVVRADLEEAKEALSSATFGEVAADTSAAIYRALVAGARALLPLFGLEPNKDREVFNAFRERLIEPGWVEPSVDGLLDGALDWRLGDADSLEGRAPEITAFVARIDELFRSLDGQLQFRIDKAVHRVAAETAGDVPATEIDLRGVACPRNFVKAKIALERVAIGHVLELLLDDGEPVRNVPASMSDQGQQVLGVIPDGTHFRVRIRRKK